MKIWHLHLFTFSTEFGHRRRMDEKLKLAMRAVTKDKVSMKAAAKQFGIARTTLKRHLSNPHVKASGRPRFFTDSEEQLLHQILRNIEVLQQPFSRPKFLEVARKLAARKGEMFQ